MPTDFYTDKDSAWTQWDSGGVNNALNLDGLAALTAQSGVLVDFGAPPRPTTYEFVSWILCDSAPNVYEICEWAWRSAESNGDYPTCGLADTDQNITTLDTLVGVLPVGNISVNSASSGVQFIKRGHFIMPAQKGAPVLVNRLSVALGAGVVSGFKCRPIWTQAQ